MVLLDKEKCVKSKSKAFQTICSSSNLLRMFRKQLSLIFFFFFLTSLNQKTEKLRNSYRLTECLEVQNLFKRVDISKYLINFGLLMSFAIFAFNEVLLDHDIEK